jgi:hypothetical protein
MGGLPGTYPCKCGKNPDSADRTHPARLRRWRPGRRLPRRRHPLVRGRSWRPGVTASTGSGQVKVTVRDPGCGLVEPNGGDQG